MPASDTYFARLPESEKLRIVEDALNQPWSPVLKHVIPNFPKELKLDLFNQLVKGGAIKYTQAADAAKEVLGVERIEAWDHNREF